MQGTGSIRGLRATVAGEIKRIREYNWRKYVADGTDGVVRGIMAGLSARELRAILRGDVPTEKPNPRYKSQVKSFILHLRPKYYQRGSTWFTHTWRLGWFSVFFFVVETITGIILMVPYAPTPEEAYGDMLAILSTIPFGLFMRDMHRLGAEGMVAVVVLHMVRVYFTGSYKGNRSFTWFTGVILLLVTLVLSFSGYLLTWDQLAYWAVTIGTSMAESAPLVGNEVNLLLRGAVDIWAGGLLRFYLLHVLLLPLLAILFISVHYYKVAREHSISLPASIEEGNPEPAVKKHAEERIDVIPDLLIHEIMLASVATFVMFLLVAYFYHAPLEAHADPQITPLHTKAPWYFLWLQGMLKLGDKQLMGVVLPTLMFAILFVVPWLDRNPHRLASKRKGAVAIGIMFSVIMVILTYMGLPQYGIETPPAQDILSHLVPATEPGPVKEMPWDEVEAGPVGENGLPGKKTYFVSYPPGWDTDPQYADPELYEFITTVDHQPGDNEFHELLRHFKSEVESHPKLMAPLDNSAPLAQVTVEHFQPNLKWAEFIITWDEFAVDDKTGEIRMEGVRPVLRRDVKPAPATGQPDVQRAVVGLHRDSNYAD
jgi:ubiquinol-cytochrome c reductase cytochrome b subunit